MPTLECVTVTTSQEKGCHTDCGPLYSDDN